MPKRVLGGEKARRLSFERNKYNHNCCFFAWFWQSTNGGFVEVAGNVLLKAIQMAARWPFEIHINLGIKPHSDWRRVRLSVLSPKPTYTGTPFFPPRLHHFPSENSFGALGKQVTPPHPQKTYYKSINNNIKKYIFQHRQTLWRRSLSISSHT